MKKTVFYLFAMLAMVSCSSDDDSSNDNGQNITEEDVFMTFEVDGEPYSMEPYTVGSMSTVVRAEEGMDETYTSVALWMPNEFTEGTHDIWDAPGGDTDAYTAQFTGNGATIDATSGTLTITSINEEYFEGTFNFSGTDGDGNEINVTNGEFRTYNLD